MLGGRGFRIGGGGGGRGLRRRAEGRAAPRWPEWRCCHDVQVRGTGCVAVYVLVMCTGFCGVDGAFRPRCFAARDGICLLSGVNFLPSPHEQFFCQERGEPSRTISRDALGSEERVWRMCLFYCVVVCLFFSFGGQHYTLEAFVYCDRLWFASGANVGCVRSVTVALYGT